MYIQYNIEELEPDDARQGPPTPSTKRGNAKDGGLDCAPIGTLPSPGRNENPHMHGDMLLCCGVLCHIRIIGTCRNVEVVFPGKQVFGSGYWYWYWYCGDGVCLPLFGVV